MSNLFEKYLKKQTLYNGLIEEKPSNKLKLIVIIPAFNEPEILNTLNTLKKCNETDFASEIIIVFNHSDETDKLIIDQNIESHSQVLNWAQNHSTEKLKFHSVLVEKLPKKHAGAGLARKISMDIAIERFKSINETDGIIASLDADTLVSTNYLHDIQKAFLLNKKINAATFYFEHLPNNDNALNHAIEIYELYLRYFKQALKYTGFPYAFHTIGSCFAVRAEAYVKQGGMNRRQGGEDFYFLHKVFPLGNCKELNHIKVYPSSRPSDRVPFGTGPAIQKIIIDGDYPTYKPEYFEYLKFLFNGFIQLFKAEESKILEFYNSLHESIKAFISEEEIVSKITEINGNCATEEAFYKRFFAWFDAFKVIKYLNFIHEKEGRISTLEAAKTFYCDFLNGKESAENINELLKVYRSLETN